MPETRGCISLWEASRARCMRRLRMHRLGRVDRAVLPRSCSVMKCSGLDVQAAADSWRAAWSRSDAPPWWHQRSGWGHCGRRSRTARPGHPSPGPECPALALGTSVCGSRWPKWWLTPGPGGNSNWAWWVLRRGSGIGGIRPGWLAGHLSTSGVTARWNPS